MRFHPISLRLVFLPAWIALFFISGPAFAAGLEQNGIILTYPERVDEGDPFLIRVESKSPLTSVKVSWFGKEVRPTVLIKDGRFAAQALLGMGLGRGKGGNTQKLTVNAASKQGKADFAVSVTRVPKTFPEQKLSVESRFVWPSPEAMERHKRERALILKAKGTVSPERRWGLKMLRPIPGEITSVFGLRRTFNGQPRSPHSGVDFDGALGTGVKACADGEVILTGDHFFAGRSIYLDHGQGVVTAYLHLSEILVKAGDQVSMGQIIGKVGKSGRVTGPHLHLTLSVLGVNVDAMPLIGKGLK